MEYREYTPRPALAPIVDRLWTLSGDAGTLTNVDQIVLPDGRCELIAHLGEPMSHVQDGPALRQPRVAFAGQIERPLSLRAAGRVDVLGVRFHSDGAAALLRVPQHSLTGVILPVDALDVRLARVFEDARCRAADGCQGIEAIQDAIEQMAAPHRLDSRARFAVRQLRRSHGRVPIEALAATVGLTRRHLERRFQHIVGLSPKRLARITRFQHARCLLESSHRRQRGAQTAASCGYADQAHFIREFRELSGQSPEAYLGADGGLTPFFVDDEA